MPPEVHRQVKEILDDIVPRVAKQRPKASNGKTTLTTMPNWMRQQAAARRSGRRITTTDAGWQGETLVAYSSCTS